MWLYMYTQSLHVYIRMEQYQATIIYSPKQYRNYIQTLAHVVTQLDTWAQQWTHVVEWHYRSYIQMLVLLSTPRCTNTCHTQQTSWNLWGHTNLNAAVQFWKAEQSPPDSRIPHGMHVHCCHSPLPPSSPHTPTTPLTPSQFGVSIQRCCSITLKKEGEKDNRK